MLDCAYTIGFVSSIRSPHRRDFGNDLVIQTTYPGQDLINVKSFGYSDDRGQMSVSLASFRRVVVPLWTLQYYQIVNRTMVRVPNYKTCATLDGESFFERGQVESWWQPNSYNGVGFFWYMLKANDGTLVMCKVLGTEGPVHRDTYTFRPSRVEKYDQVNWYSSDSREPRLVFRVGKVWQLVSAVSVD